MFFLQKGTKVVLNTELIKFIYLFLHLSNYHQGSSFFKHVTASCVTSSPKNCCKHKAMLNYKYYDSPEGQDIYKKVFVTSKYATMSGLGFGVFDVLMFSHPKGFTGTVGRLAYFVGPAVGMAAAFTVTANVAQNIRGKNDKINYFLGGAVAGSVFGAWQRSITIGVPAAVLLGVAAVVKKTGVDDGWTFFPDIHTAHQTATTANNDFTLAKDVIEYKTWSTGH